MRGEWTFPMGRDEVLALAERCLAYHVERLEFYRREQTAAEKALRETGVEIKDRRDQRFGAGTRTYSAQSINVVVNDEMVRRVDAAVEKVNHHSEQQRVFSRWVRALRGHLTGAPLELTLDDLNYFHY
jgi:hypothetical protein